MDEEHAREIAIRILDEFEELLDEKGITIPSADREGHEEEACLYGREYYQLEDAVVGILMDELATVGTKPTASNEARPARETLAE